MHSKHSGNKQQDGNTRDLTETRLQPYKLEVADGQESVLMFSHFVSFREARV